MSRSRSTYLDLAARACLKAALRVLQYKYPYLNCLQSLVSTLQLGTVSGALTARSKRTTSLLLPRYQGSGTP